jgi:hypothetical protein
MKRILGMIVAVVAAGALTVTGLAPASASPRAKALHVTKECSQYTGAAGSFCTITASNLRAIKVGSRVVYSSAANTDGTLDSDISIDMGHGNRLFGHVTLNATTMHIWLTGGTGIFHHFTGSAAVTVTDAGTPKELWHWDGTYTFGSEHDRHSGD